MNGSDHSKKAKDIFADALALTSLTERRACLERACAGNQALREEVESLLRAHDQAGGFLRPPVSAGAAQKTMPIPRLNEMTGTRIGRYKLLERIGEGGMGVVWMAEQEEPVRRRVALKIIKLGMDTKEVVARFEAERQALAMMDHPNIASVLDGGATEAGRPYFVMELVKGLPITDYCNTNKRSTPDRLRLFTQVCQAVQHAHQKGIIHRDLKPSNILVTVKDDRPLPKVIDFGVAKAIQARLTEKTLFTQFHQLIGTPAYMSPEQAGPESLDVDTPSDIYALGVLLYDLLTGQTPCNTQLLLEKGYETVMRVIREEEPPKPSTCLSTMPAGDLKTTAQQRQSDPSALVQLIRGDLDWIVMKTLEKKTVVRTRLSGADRVVDLRLEPIVLENPPRPVSLFGMQLADATPELQELYDQDEATGVVVLDAGTNCARLGISGLAEGCRFCMAGDRKINNLHDMVSEMLQIEQRLSVLEGRVPEIRVVYTDRGRHGTDTEFLKLTDNDVHGLMQFAASHP